MENKRAQLQSNGYVILRQVVAPEQLDQLRSDIETVVKGQRVSDPAWDTTSQPRASIVNHVNVDTLGAFEFVLHKHTYGVSARLLDRPQNAVAATSAEVLCNPEFTPDNPQRPGQGWGTDPRNWHRDVRPDRDGPLDALLEDQIANGPGYLQWNIALYEDSILYVVPGSHRRLTTQAEASHLLCDQVRLTPVPESQCVELEPGDGVIYNNMILHWGSKYSPQKKRRTIHLGYRSFGRIFPHQSQNYLPVGFWNRFAEGTPERCVTERWFELFRSEFRTIEGIFRAALASDGERFFAGITRLHPPSKGLLACLILLSKIALALEERRCQLGDDRVGADAVQSVCEWQLRELTLHFSDEELDQLRQRFGPVDEALQIGLHRHVAGFIGPTTNYEFEKIPKGITMEGMCEEILGRQRKPGGPNFPDNFA